MKGDDGERGGGGGGRGSGTHTVVSRHLLYRIISRQQFTTNNLHPSIRAVSKTNNFQATAQNSSRKEVTARQRLR